MNCPSCSAIVPPNSPVCPQCGANVFAGGAPGAPGFGGPPRTSGKAIAGFILAFLCSLLGLIFSILGYKECKESNGQIKGEGLALAGIIISILMMVLGVALRLSR